MDDDDGTVHDAYSSYVKSSQEKIPLPKSDPRMPSPETVNDFLAGRPWKGMITETTDAQGRTTRTTRK